MNIDIIKKILENEGMNILIDFNEVETENYFKPLKRCEDESYDSNDTRYMLNKRRIHIWKFLKKIGAKLEYIKSGTTGHTFKGEIEKDGKIIYEFALKMTPYQNRKQYGEVTNISRPENAEIMMLRVLSYFITTKQTPHLIIPIQTFYSSIKYFLTLAEENYIKKDVNRYSEFVSRYKDGKYDDIVSILISEWANKGDFLSFIKKRYTSPNFKLVHWRVFFFQILSVLAVIQSKYPSFRHNDMKANNILIQKLTSQNNDTTHHSKKIIDSYTICGMTYAVPHIGYQIKLWDFDFACIPGIVDNIKVTEEWTREINITVKKNQYYDIHYFFNTLVKDGFFPEILNKTKVDPHVGEFINRVLPEHFRKKPTANAKGRLMVDNEYLTPQRILENDPFFEVFRIKPLKI